jgi:uncharacterized protein
LSILSQIGSSIVATFLQMAPYLLLGLTISGILHVVISSNLVLRYLGKPGIGSVIRAALIGVPLPLCSCGVLPLALSLRKDGASKGSTVSFLISTPQTGVDSMIATYGMLGLPFAIFRPIAAFLMGIFGGVITDLFDREKSGSAAALPAFNCSICQTATPHRHSFFEKVKGMARYAYADFLDGISPHLVIGIVIAGLIAFVIPQDVFTKYLHNDFIAMLVMIAIGAPLYVCATASIPIAMAFMLKGASPGAAFVFLTVGPATNAAAIALVGHALGKKTAVIYLTSIALLSMAAGYTLNFVLSLTGGYTLPSVARRHCHGDAATPADLIFGGVFLLLLLLSLYRTTLLPAALKLAKRMRRVETAGSTCSLTVEGMSCQKCARKVSTAALGVSGVAGVKVDLESKRVTVDGAMDIAKVKKAIEAAGYGVRD